MRILVTGGSGFLGSHVADVLSEQGHEVTILDIRKSPYAKGNQKMIVGDILDQETVDTVVQENDIVYHFSGIADIDECADRPVETVKYNVLGTVQLLESCRKADIKRFIFASSVYVYSNSGYFYRTSKRACESFIEDYAELFGIKYTILRYGSLYGERVDERSSIYKLIWQALSEGRITYRGTGEELREYIHVRDAAQISAEILKQEFENQHVILAGTEKMRYRDLLEMIKEILGNKIDIEILPSERKAHYKITPYNFSPTLGRKLINNPHIDMGQGLLQCMTEIYEKIHNDTKEEMGFLIENQ